MVRTLNTLKRLPASLNRGIGRLVVADSYLELALGQIVYELVGVGQKEGRLAIREPRAVERLEMIEDLARVHGIKITADLKVLRKALEASTSNRDLVCHGVWFKEPVTSEFLVRLVRGSWPREDGYKKPKRTLPHGVHMYEEKLAKMLVCTEAAIAAVEDLHAEIKVGLAASPRKPL